MAPAEWPRYWVDHGWVQVACLVGLVAAFCLARLRPRPVFGIDYAIHFHGSRSTRDAGLSLPPGPVALRYRASIRLMNTGRSEITESDLPGGVVIAVRPPPGILVGQVASPGVPYGAVTLEPLGPASVSVLAHGLQPGDWMDVDLLTDRRVSIGSVRAQFVPPERERAPRRRRLRPYDGTQLVVDLIGFPFAVTAAVLVARALPQTSETALDDAAHYGWFLLAVWALMSLWGLMDQSLRYIGRSEWPGHPRVSLRWVDPDVQRP